MNRIEKTTISDYKFFADRKGCDFDIENMTWDGEKVVIKESQLVFENGETVMLRWYRNNGEVCTFVNSGDGYKKW